MLAVIAAELRGSSTAKKTPSLSFSQKRLLPEFPVPILETHTARYRTCRSKFCKLI